MILVRSGKPVAPVDVADAIILYFRERGRNATVEWIDAMHCFAALVSLKASDPLLGAWNEGRLTGERVPSEDVFLHERNPHPQAGKIRRDFNGKPIGLVPIYRPLDLAGLGVSGIIEFLQQHDTQSGRGEFVSLAAAVQHSAEQQRVGTAKIKTEQRNLAVDRYKDMRRQVEKIPYHTVGIDLQQPPQDAAATRD
jgi:hypothetical protein